MKIAIISLDNSDSIQAGGKHIHQQLLKKGLNEAGHHVYNFFPERSLFYLACRVAFVILEKLKLTNKAKVFEWTLQRHMNNLIYNISTSKESFDAVFAQDPVSAVAARRALSQSKIKIILTLHGYLSLESVNYGNFNKEEREKVIDCAREFEKDSLSVCDSVISVDSRIAEYIKREFFYDKKLTILKNAINPELFNVLSENEKEKLKSKLGVGQEKKIILIPRRLVKKNGVEVAIRAFSSLKIMGNNNFVFLIMGDGPLNKDLHGLREELGISSSEVIFLGSVEHSQAAQFYDLSDIVLVPSIISDGIEEATSLSMLEGMAAKKIVIVSNIGGMKEVIKDKINGFIFEQSKHNQLAELIERIEKIPKDDIGVIKENAFKDVCKYHHYKHHSSMYLEQIGQ